MHLAFKIYKKSNMEMQLGNQIFRSNMNNQNEDVHVGFTKMWRPKNVEPSASPHERDSLRLAIFTWRGFTFKRGIETLTTQSHTMQD